MDPVSQTLLLQVMQIALIACAISIVIRAMIDHLLPGHHLCQGGKVWTEPICAVDLVGVFLLFVLFYRSLDGDISPPAPSDDELPANALNAVFILQGALSMLILSGLIVMVMAMRGTSIVEFFGLDRLSPGRVILWSVAGCLIAYYTAIFVGYYWMEHFITPVMGKPEAQEMITFFKETATPSDQLAVIVSACLIAPLAEEVIFRGYIYPVLKKFTEPVLAAILVSVIFALVHQNLTALAPLCMMSLILVLAYETTASLWVPVAIHSLFNSTNLLLTHASP